MRAKGKGYDVSAEGIKMLTAGHVLGLKVQWDDILYIKNVEGSRTFRVHYYGINPNVKSAKSLVRSAVVRVNKNYEFRVATEHIETVNKICKQCMPGLKYEKRKRTILESHAIFLAISIIVFLLGFVGFGILGNSIALIAGAAIALVINVVGFILTDRSKLINIYRPGKKPERYQSPF